MMRRKITVPVPVGLVVLLACALLLLLPAYAHAGDVIRVDADTGNDQSGNGTLAAPYATIAKGLSMASSGDVVRVANGVYEPEGTMVVEPGVRVTGQAPAWKTEVRGDGTFSIFSITDASSDTIIEGFLIDNGGGADGGAIKIVGGASPHWGPTIQRNLFYSNTVTGDGGAIHISKGAASSCSPTIQYNTFSYNTAADSGGSIYSEGANLEILGNRFSAGAAYGAGPSGGGAIYSEGGNGFIRRCVFDQTNATGYGGGIRLGTSAGVIYIDGCLFSECEAFLGGGIYTSSVGVVDIRNGVFYDNTAGSQGGAARFFESDTRLSGCTVYGNQASVVGGLSFYDNSEDDPSTIHSSILWGNGGDDVTEDSDATCDLTVTYTLLEEYEPGTGNIIATDPRLVASPDSAWRLSSLSPCIDRGNPDVIMLGDFDGHERLFDGDGADGPRQDMGAFEYGSTIGRLAGSDRFSTSVECLQDRYGDSTVAILATGRGYPDALCAAGLAGVYDAPVLLTDTNSLPTSVRDQLSYMQTREVFIVGGTGAVGPGVVAELEAMEIDVTRLAGSDRYATSQAVAEHIGDLGMTGLCYVARGDNFPDALSLAPLAAGIGGPVLLTRPTSLPPTTLAALQDYPWGEALVAGGTSAVSDSVYDLIEAEIPAGNIKRAAGSDRYGTAAAVGRWASDNGYAIEDFIGLAVGNNFPDALAGGAACGYEGGLLLLTGKDGLHPAAASFMGDYPDRLHEIYVFGGTGVISDQVLADCVAEAP